MKLIPTHSLVIYKGLYDEATKVFGQTAVLDIEKIRAELGLVDSRPDLQRYLEQEFIRRVEWYLQLGHRVVAVGDWHHVPFRQELARAADALGVSIFYTSEETEKEFGTADRLGEFVRLKPKTTKVSQPYPLDDLGSALIAAGYSGITAIGDVHGQREALKEAIQWSLRRNHFIIFLGDVVDYGAKPLECLEEVYDLCIRGRALFIIGNHEKKIARWFEQSEKGDVRLRLSQGNKVTINAYNRLDKSNKRKWRAKFLALYNQSAQHLEIYNTLFVHGAAHTDIWNNYVHRLTGEVETRALFGQISVSTPRRADGYPNRIYDWVDEIPNDKLVIVGHDIRSTIMPTQVTGKLGGTAVFVDTGSGKGGILSSVDMVFAGKKLRVSNFNQY